MIEPAQAKKSSFFTWKVVVGACAVALVIGYFSIKSEESASLSEIDNARLVEFDERLLSCNDVETAAPSLAHDTCLSAAKDGEVMAIKRIIWAYSRQSDYQDLGKVFEWLRALPYKDSATQLLMFSLVHLNTDSDTLRKDSEIGITSLVAKNYAPANVVLASIYALNENITAPTSNTIWMLNRANKKDPRIIDASTLALIHANGFVGEVNIAAATSLLKDAAESDFPMTTNNIAWFLATLDNNPFTQSEYALSLAQRVVEDPAHGQNPIYVDTLAATFAANNMFDKAVETQKRALKLVATSEFTQTAMAQVQQEYKQRLTLYLQKEALIEEVLSVDKITFFRNIRNRVLDYVLRDFFIPIESPAFFVNDLAENAKNQQIQVQ